MCTLPEPFCRGDLSAQNRHLVSSKPADLTTSDPRCSTALSDSSAMRTTHVKQGPLVQASVLDLREVKIQKTQMTLLETVPDFWSVRLGICKHLVLSG